MFSADTPPPAYQAQDDSQQGSMGLSQPNSGMHRPQPPDQNGPQPMDTTMPPTIPLPKHVSNRGIGILVWIQVHIFSRELL